MGHIGSLFIIVFLFGLFSLCVVPWVICFMFRGGVGVGLFIFFLVISICTELLCFGRGI